MLSRAYFSVCKSLTGIASLIALEASGVDIHQDRLQFTDKVLDVASTFAMPQSVHLTGEKAVMYVRADKPLTTLVLNEGSTTDELKIVVESGATLLIKDAWVRRCAFDLASSATLIATNAAFHNCEFSSHSVAVAGRPRCELNNCFLSGVRFVSSLEALGAELQDCSIKTWKNVPSVGNLSRNELYALSRNPRLRYCLIESCELKKELLFGTSNCTFQECRITDANAASAIQAAADGGAFIHVPCRWISGTPPALPVIASKVMLDPVTEVLMGGCSLKISWEGTEPRPAEGFPSFGETPQNIKEILPATTSAPAQVAVKRLQTHVNGLLVASLTGGKAGEASRMNLTATPGSSRLEFNQPVGGEMTTALNEVRKFMILRHGGLPSSHCLQIAFEEKYSSKDGPSAAVACGLLVEAAITDMDIDPKLAVTGDMNADGQVQPIGGVAAKLRGATRSECSILAIPSKNESALADMMIRDGPGPLVGISVFSIEKFDDACELANPKRKEALQQALNEMEIIRSALKRDPSMMLTILRSPQAVTRLQEVLKKAPNCLSAKYLLLYATGAAPKYLTLAGSIEAADNDADILVSSINSDLNRAASQFQQDQVGGTLNRLRNLRPRVDQRVWPYVDGLVAYGEVLRSVILNPIKSASRAADVQRQAKGAAANVNSTRDKLLSDPAVREELGL